MKDIQDLLKQIKNSITNSDPDAVLILYGSYARGDNTDASDVDLLVLVDKDVISRTDQKRIKYPLYDIEFDTGTIISPMIFTKKDWETRYRNTPFYQNVTSEGRVL
jgi:predicted nucleotidyltransferase